MGKGCETLEARRPQIHRPHGRLNPPWLRAARKRKRSASAGRYIRATYGGRLKRTTRGMLSPLTWKAADGLFTEMSLKQWSVCKGIGCEECGADDDQGCGNGGGIEVTFADGRSGLVPFAALPEVPEFKDLSGVELPNAYELVLETVGGERVEIPWDFARHYCDESYRPVVERRAAEGRKGLGARIRGTEGGGWAYAGGAGSYGRYWACDAGAGGEGEQSPRFETLVAVGRALGLGVEELVEGRD